MPSHDPKGPADEALLELLRKRAETLSEQGIRSFPSERKLASKLNTSRRAVRKALSILEDEGKIVREQGSGTRLVDAEEAVLTPTDLKKYTDPLAIMEARLAFEPVVAAVASNRASSQDLEEMRKFLEQGRKATSPKEWERTDSTFHRAIGRATHNRLLAHFSQVLASARSATAWGKLRKASLTPARQKEYVMQHEAILAAIQSRDDESARLAMRRHLLMVRATLFEL